MPSWFQQAPRMWRRTGASALHLLFPPICASCAADIESQGASTRLCRDCLARLPLVEQPVCPKCAAPVPATNGASLPCPVCARQRFWFDATLAAGWYEGLLRDLVLRMKTDRRGVVAYALAEAMAVQLGDQLRDAKIDLVAPSPMHRWRHWQRGAHPAALLAGALCANFGWPMKPGLLKKRRRTPPQAGLSREGRFRNVRGSIGVSRRISLSGVSVLLVDDVMTTGATSSETARLLKQAGAARVVATVAARTRNVAAAGHGDRLASLHAC